MKNSIIIYLIFTIICPIVYAQSTDKQGAGQEFWSDGFFIQKTVKADAITEMKIEAEVDGQWKKFDLVNLPEDFLNWNFNARIKTIQDIKTGQRPALNGPHNAVIATYGYQREDSEYALNNAVKGCGFLPRKDKMKEVISKLETTYDSDFMIKLQILIDYYENYSDYFDLSKQVSLELYSTEERGTQTFVNQMSNPASVLVFLDIPTYKLKTIAYLIHPENPRLTEYEKDVVKYINLIHSYFHGDFSQDFIAVVYNISEVYNSSPGNDNGRGKLIIP